MLKKIMRRKGLWVVFVLSSVLILFFCCTKSYEAYPKDSNGKTIYYTGYNNDGEKIPISYGPHWIYMHGGSCVDCHGEDGVGGKPVMMLSKIPPDIRYSTLTSTEHHHEGEEEDEHEVPYKDEDIIKAIREGIEPSGEVMDYGMPRWSLTDRDAQDLLEFIKGLK